MSAGVYKINPPAFFRAIRPLVKDLPHRNAQDRLTGTTFTPEPAQELPGQVIHLGGNH